MQDSTGGHKYTNTTWWKHLVSEYTGLNFHQIGELEYIQYLIWRRDAYISYLEKTEAGQQYLDDAWRMEQTEPDRQALRKRLRKERIPDGRKDY